MSKNLDELGLKSIFSEYDLFFIDIWGVVHNGIKLYENAIKVLEELSKNEKKFILLTNAPRPNLTVVNTLKKMGLNNFSDTVFTSGEASKRYLLENFNNKKFFHLGPPRDFDLFKTSANASSSIKPPRAQLINFALLFILLSTSIFTKFSVSGVRGKCKVT